MLLQQHSYHKQGSWYKKVLVEMLPYWVASILGVAQLQVELLELSFWGPFVLFAGEKKYYLTCCFESVGYEIELQHLLS